MRPAPCTDPSTKSDDGDLFIVAKNSPVREPLMQGGPPACIKRSFLQGKWIEIGVPIEEIHAFESP
jgi:hypothetical protein